MPQSPSRSTAVVTGASSGIGRAIAVELARLGTGRIVVHYCNNVSGAQQTAARLEELGARSDLIRADLAVPEDRIRLVRESFESLGDVQTWVNNAGADVLTGDAATWNFDAKLAHLIQVDVLGTIALSRLVAEEMLAREPGSPADDLANQGTRSMAFLGWDQATAGMEGDAGQMFGTVKAAVIAFAASLAQSLAPRIRVNTISPGWIQTSWGESTSDYWDARARGQSLMGRWGRPEDVAGAVAFVTDPANTFLTGQTIDINGGWNRRGQPRQ